ncbi:MAG: dihydropteroate synthase [Bacteroidaceae bacterium]|nr:dihydropteroate synthase [Bacteroidaceae bacterium]
MKHRFINVGGRLMDLSRPQVMGILNVTPDSFYGASRHTTEEGIAERVRQIVEEGATIIDVGAYSSRPGADDVSEAEEMERLRLALKVVRNECPDAVVSVDTFRSSVARMCVEEYGADIINDISGGEMDGAMFQTVAQLGVPYVLMHMKGTPADMQTNPHYGNLVGEVVAYFAERVQRLRDLGQKDIILDLGFGFGKTIDHNYELFSQMGMFADLFGLPMLVGVSRKSMIYRLLGGEPSDALNGTTALNAMALMSGANILRVHDVRECVEAVRLFEKMKSFEDRKQ